MVFVMTSVYPVYPIKVKLNYLQNKVPGNETCDNLKIGMSFDIYILKTKFF
jgi:hypothetical protein